MFEPGLDRPLNPKDERKEAILKAALDVFKKYGLKKTTLEDIAVQAGLATTSLYYYFENKKDLFQSVVSDQLEKLFERMGQLLAQVQEPVDKLRGLTLTLGQFLEDLGPLSPVELKNLQEAIWEVRDFKESFAKELIRMVREVLQQGLDRGVFRVRDVDAVASTLSMALSGFVHEIIEDGKVAHSRQALQDLIDLLIRGMKQGDG